MMNGKIKELPACSVETTLTLIGDKWKVLILRDLIPGTKRFGELKKSIGTVSQKVLTASAPGYGGKRAGSPRGLRRGASKSGVFSDRSGQKPSADSEFHGGLGRGIQKAVRGINKQHRKVNGRMSWIWRPT